MHAQRLRPGGLNLSEIQLKTVCFENFCFDFQRGTLTRDGKRVPLRPKASALLSVLIRAKGELVTYDQLYGEIWGLRVVGKQEGIYRLVRDVRKALGDDAESPRFIRTIPGKGYIFFSATDYGAPKRSRDNRVAFASGLACFPVAFVLYCTLVALS